MKFEMKKKLLKIFVIIIIVIIVLLGISAIVLKNWYDTNLKPVNSESNSETIQIEITSGMGKSAIADLLEENKVIKNATVFKIYLKLNEVNLLKAGKYEFENGIDNVSDIINKISNGDVIDESIKLTFIEGQTIEDYAKVIAENTVNTEEDVYNLLKDEEYIDSLIQEYWFITDVIKDADIYYPLEGYLKPDTYIFENENVSVEKIFKQLLDYTDKTLSKYREDIETSNLSVHQILTMASVIELETNLDEDRATVASVFYNRLYANMNMGSDVTTYYAFHMKMSEGDLTTEQINTYNPYNTRHSQMAGKLPIGPISAPREESIKAVIYPENTNYYYFVSDKTGKDYFSTNYSEHQKTIQNLKSQGLWYSYEK
jgi:UPF0755 protein